MRGEFARRAGSIIAVAAATWVVLALVLYLLFYRTIESVYQNSIRSVLHVSCGRLVPGELIYTLAPGECRFANAEFDVRVEVDADGFRNVPEQRGSGPLKIAVIGDSHVMGWGVPQAEKIGSLLARDPRLSVHDLSMSSYGTVRELIALLRYAADADVVVLQYCFNDRSENAELAANPNGFAEVANARSRTYAEELAQARETATRSSMSKGLLNLGLAGLTATWRLMWLPPRTPREPSAAIMGDEAKLFATVVAHFKSALAGKTVIVFESFPRAPRPSFAPAIRAALAEAGVGGIEVLDLVGTIGPRDYYYIDDHMRPRGHAKVARRVLAAIESARRLPAVSR